MQSEQRGRWSLMTLMSRELEGNTSSVMQELAASTQSALWQWIITNLNKKFLIAGCEVLTAMAVKNTGFLVYVCRREPDVPSKHWPVSRLHGLTEKKFSSSVVLSWNLLVRYHCHRSLLLSLVYILTNSFPQISLTNNIINLPSLSRRHVPPFIRSVNLVHLNLLNVCV